jgi:hypothetical protein
MAKIQKQQECNGQKVYVGARVPADLKAKLSARAKRERRSEAAIIELMLTRELAVE